MGMELENRMVNAEWLKTRCYEICDAYNTNFVNIDRIIDEIDDAPDVEVVRCKDCKHYEKPDEGDCLGVCRSGRLAVSIFGEIYPEPDYYCPYGERKEKLI